MLIKKSMVIIGGLLFVVLMNACSAAPAIQYNGKERPIDEVEEMIADSLESENPSLDFTVEIQDEIE